MTDKEAKKRKQQAQAEKNRLALVAYCEQHGFPLPEPEHVFCAHRGWKFDFAWPDVRIALELEGGTFMQGRHSSGPGQRADMEKYNEAQIRGWLVLRVETSKARSARMMGLLWRAMMARGAKASKAIAKPVVASDAQLEDEPTYEAF